MFLVPSFSADRWLLLRKEAVGRPGIYERSISSLLDYCALHN